ncbi:hypothetical protein KIN20_006816 [Parelaphostrongylus tenuis]|uniref:Uncharacterized protein n=1 Tax=Parelaphostrongylus tenuis TaxID=148309 RepID=A0AAD5MKN0_PARTN|nr:hypothetical protein KIN20_006816 [Parelaphostrongylus tenuis]
MADFNDSVTSSKDSEDGERYNKLRGQAHKTLPLPRSSKLAAERNQWNNQWNRKWHNMGRNQRVSRFFVPAAVSMFAETMRPSLEKYHGRIFTSFTETVRMGMPFWEKLSEEDQEGWAVRARVEKKVDQYLYFRKAREKFGNEREVSGFQISDCDSDSDELPGELCYVNPTEQQTVTTETTQSTSTCSSPCPSPEVSSEKQELVEPQEKPKPPINNHVAPVQKPKPPINNYVAPMQKPKPPINNYVAPVQKPKPPINNYVAPVEKPKPPINNYVAPVQKPKPPINNYVAPVEKPKPPINNYVAPVPETPPMPAMPTMPAMPLCDLSYTTYRPSAFSSIIHS